MLLPNPPCKKMIKIFYFFEFNFFLFLFSQKKHLFEFNFLNNKPSRLRNDDIYPRLYDSASLI